MSMTEIVGVRFTPGGKVYHFSPEGRKLAKDTKVIVETVRGVECGEIALENTEVSSDSIATALKPIKRVATKEDLDRIEKNKEKEKQAFDYCEERIAARGLNMKLINVECMFDNRKLLFYFSADGRIDFRELVKDLASVFKTRIELRQIGVRDEAKLLGGIGVCGREYCCKGCLRDFTPVSIKMAKEQGLSLNPGKISGACGKLMCCLKYEHNVYDELLKITPKVGAIVNTKSGRGKVVETNILAGTLKVLCEGNDVPVQMSRDEVRLIKDAHIKVGKDEIKALKDLEKD